MSKSLPTTQEIEALVAAAKAWEPEAFGKLFTLLSEQIYRYSLLRVGNILDAQDITSETFKRAWSYIKYYRHDNFRAYLFRIAHNLICDYYASEKKANVAHKAKIETVVAKQDNLIDKIAKNEEIANLGKAIDQLPPHYAEIISLRFIEELSVKETAKIIGKSELIVRVTQYRALRLLKKILS
ncbi:hypothetical protein A2160_05340 [Candidatus Beckwithbacteria bacterium RBG_13_42_9]|uniref:RNA polymerase sigma factor n=1 Tax=Candidatus Beckwithbacteria bacterium RBG_13_42_9 TaxID=1797457 RepID=A0A1F5E6K6_9BACT|nr:MAG: hypothetical protein A2160_05340 [Candidatus Beckwithbacteria bacterium RBG_13_42_9]